MSGVVGVIRSHEEAFPTEGIFQPLPRELRINIFSYLVAENDFLQFSATCHEYRKMTIEAINVYLKEKESLNCVEIQALHRPLCIFLIHSQERYIKVLGDYSVPEIASYVLAQAKNLIELDVTNTHFTPGTFLGATYPFAPNEVATQSVHESPQLSQNEQMSVIERMRTDFHNDHARNIFTSSLQTLRVSHFSSIPDVTDIEACASAFPYVKTLDIIETEKLNSQIFQRIRENFLHLQTLILRNYTG